jgi:hypothetical protein
VRHERTTDKLQYAEGWQSPSRDPCVNQTIQWFGNAYPGALDCSLADTITMRA